MMKIDSFKTKQNQNPIQNSKRKSTMIKAYFKLFIMFQSFVKAFIQIYREL